MYNVITVDAQMVGVGLNRHVSREELTLSVNAFAFWVMHSLNVFYEMGESDIKFKSLTVGTIVEPPIKVIPPLSANM